MYFTLLRLFHTLVFLEPTQKVGGVSVKTNICYLNRLRFSSFCLRDFKKEKKKSLLKIELRRHS